MNGNHLSPKVRTFTMTSKMGTFVAKLLIKNETNMILKEMVMVPLMLLLIP